MTVKMPYQCFINGQFTDAEDGKTYDTINPTDGSVSCDLVCAVTTDHGFFFSFIHHYKTVFRITYSITLSLYYSVTLSEHVI